jgi:phosphate transport system substrate-binding protein
VLAVGLAMGLLGMAPAAAGADHETVTIKGSDTMVILVQRWIEIYHRSHHQAVVQLTGGGSLTGIAALLNGTTDLAASSVPMNPAEVARAEARSGRALRRIPVALDVLAIFVHPSNPIEEISLGQLRDVLTGRVESWRELGGLDAPIAIYGRDHSSGSYRFIREVVLGGSDFDHGAESLPGTGTVADNVAHDRNGLGYGGIAYAHGVKHLRIRRADRSSAVEGTAETARSGEYGLARKLFLFGFEPLGAAEEAFVAWVLGEEGQRVVAEVGYFPLEP